MNKFLQVLCYLVSLALVFLIGCVFEWVIPIEIKNTKDLLPGKELPPGFLFFVQNPSTLGYLFLFPWLAFAGLPLFGPTRESYWDVSRFLLRFCVFIMLELLLLLLVSIDFYLPWIPMINGMSEHETPIQYTWIETSVAGVFWGCVLVLVITAIWRSVKDGKTKN